MTLNTRGIPGNGTTQPAQPAPLMPILTITPPVVAPANIPGPPPPNAPWRHISEVRQIGYNYVEARYNRLIRSFKSPWTSINDAGVDGFEWGTINVIGGRPGGGKTALVNQMTRTGFKNNPGTPYAVLDFQFEMTAKSTAVREFSTVMGQSVKEILNADRNKPMTAASLSQIQNFVNKHSNDPIYQIEDPMTVADIERWIYSFSDYIQMPVVVTIDHSILVRKGQGERDKFETLYELGEMVTRVKKKISVIFFILTQMNRSIEDMARRTPGSAGNYPMTSDVWGADALLQHCDTMMVLNKPWDYNIGYYGPHNYIVGPNLIACHLLKMRNGVKDVLFFDADFEKMSLKETIPLVQGQSPASGLNTANINTNTSSGQKYQNKNRPAI